MLPSMPVLFPRESQSSEGFLHLLSPTPAWIQPAPPLIQIADDAGSYARYPVQNGTKEKEKEKEKVEVPTETEEELEEINFVTAFYNKAQSKLGADQFARFRETLSRFVPQEDGPAELYRRLEELLGDGELLEEFLLFLTPGQASEVGRFMEHLMLTRISKFIRYLKSTFARKPAKLRQVLRALQGGGDAADAAALRARVEPHLRSSPRLLAHFRALLPDERVPDSLYTEEHTEEFPESAWASDSGFHCIELDDAAVDADKKQAAGPQALDVTYLQGRVFLQDGRVLRPARVTFPGSSLTPHEHARRLDPSQPHLATSAPALDSDDDRTSPRRPAKNLNKSPKKTTKSACVRNIMKGKEKNKSPERTAKHTEPIKKSVKIDIDAQIEAKTAINIDRTISSELGSAIASTVTQNDNAKGSALVNQGLRGTADSFVRGKRKREASPDPLLKIAGQTEERKKLNKTKQLKRLEARKTDDVKVKGEIEKSQSKVGNFATKYDKNKLVKHKVENQIKIENEHKKTGSYISEQIEESKSFQENVFIKPEIPKPHPKRPDRVPSCDWTRHEDKTILQVLKKETESEETFNKIMELLPHRTLAEVKARFFHVMDLLQQMALGEVT